LASPSRGKPSFRGAQQGKFQGGSAMTSKKPNMKSNLLTAFENSVKANPELAKGDFAAIVEAGRATCIQIDDGLNSEDEAKAKAAAYQMPYLVGILKEMHATP